ncbi:MAG: hypothetical protein ACRC7N_02960 [Clostridium sp.]
MLNKINKKTKIIIGGILCLIAIFTISYVVTGTYLDKKEESQVKKENEERERIALQKEKNLPEVTKVQYYTGDEMDSEKTIKDIKKALRVETISLDELKENAKKDGYEIKNKGETIISFIRTNNSAYEEGKYYLGFNDNKLAIFKFESGKMKYEMDVEHTKTKDELKLKGVANSEIEAIEKHEKSGTLEAVEDIAINYTS